MGSGLIKQTGKLDTRNKVALLPSQRYDKDLATTPRGQMRVEGEMISPISEMKHYEQGRLYRERKPLRSLTASNQIRKSPEARLPRSSITPKL